MLKRLYLRDKHERISISYHLQVTQFPNPSCYDCRLGMNKVVVDWTSEVINRDDQIHLI